METIHATPADAELTLRLYDLRRETEMRKARNWFGGEFWPKSFSEIEQSMMQFESPQNHWFRQVLSYWDMAAALVLHGAYNPSLFYDTCGEAWMCYVKMKPFLQECRTKFSPEFLIHLEKIIESSSEGRKRAQEMEEHFKHWAAISEQRKKQRQNAASEAA